LESTAQPAISRFTLIAYLSLIIVEINRELHNRGIETRESKVDRLLRLEELIRKKQCLYPEILRFGVTDKLSTRVSEKETLEAQGNEYEVNSEKSLINKFMEQIG